MLSPCRRCRRCPWRRCPGSEGRVHSRCLHPESPSCGKEDGRAGGCWANQPVHPRPRAGPALPGYQAVHWAATVEIPDPVVVDAEAAGARRGDLMQEESSLRAGPSSDPTTSGSTAPPHSQPRPFPPAWLRRRPRSGPGASPAPSGWRWLWEDQRKSIGAAAPFPSSPLRPLTAPPIPNTDMSTLM